MNETPSFKVTDRRHWVRGAEADEGPDTGEAISTEPTVVGEYRRRAEDAERKLLDYIAAFKEAREEQEAFRERLARDVDRRVDLKFGEILDDLLPTLDDLDLALSHAAGLAAAEPIARGVALARERFLAALARQGVERIDPFGTAFDPATAEAVRVDAVADPGQDGQVTETLRPGYRLGERIIRAARVAVGRLKA